MSETIRACKHVCVHAGSCFHARVDILAGLHYDPTHPSIRVRSSHFNHSFRHLSIHPSIHPSFHPSIHPSLHPSIHSFIRPCIHACIQSSIAYSTSSPNFIEASDQELRQTEANRPASVCIATKHETPTQGAHAGVIARQCQPAQQT